MITPAVRTVRLAWRSLWRTPLRTAATAGSIALGLALVVFFLSVKRGQFAQLLERIVALQGGHLALEHPGYREAPDPRLAVRDVAALERRLAALPQVARTRPLVLGEAFVRSAGGAAGALLAGVHADTERAASPLPGRVVAGRYLEEGDEAAVVLGSRLAEELRVGPGKKVVIAVGGADGELVEELARVAGVFTLGADEADGHLVQVPLGFARRLLGLGAGEATQLFVILEDPGAAEEALPRIREIAAGGGAAVRRWQEILPEVASFVGLGLAWSSLYQGFLLLLILFAILNTLLVAVLERRREFAVLLALGTPPRLLQLQVFAETALLGLVGCALGLAVGGAAAYLAAARGIDLRHLLAEGMSISGHSFDLVVRPRPTIALLLWSGGLEFAAILLLGLFPMRLATRGETAELLR